MASFNPDEELNFDDLLNCEEESIQSYIFGIFNPYFLFHPDASDPPLASFNEKAAHWQDWKAFHDAGLLPDIENNTNIINLLNRETEPAIDEEFVQMNGRLVYKELIEIIKKMMFVSGETGEPSIETIARIEKIVQDQVKEMVSHLLFLPHARQPLISPSVAQSRYWSCKPRIIPLNPNRAHPDGNSARSGKDPTCQKFFVLERRSQKRQRIRRAGQGRYAA